MLVLWTENKKEICLGRRQSPFLPPWPSTWQKQPEREDIYLTHGFRGLRTPWQRGQWEMTLSQHTEIIEEMREGTRARHGPQEHTQPVIDFLCLIPPSSHPRNVIILRICQGVNPMMRSEPSWSNRLQKQHHRHPQNCFIISWLFLNPFKMIIKINHNEKWSYCPRTALFCMELQRIWKTRY